MVKVVNIPSYSVKPGQVVGVREKSNHWKLSQCFGRFQSQQISLVEWDENSKVGKLLHVP
jgi:small subunit ribosomal protein S4